MDEGGDSKDGAKLRKTLGTYLAYFLAAPLLCVPILGLLRYDTSQREGANGILRDRIAQIDAQIADIKDLNKVHSHWLARKQIVEHIQIDAAKPLVPLPILSRLPADVQLLFLESRADQLALVVRYATPDGDLATIEQLAKSGFGDVRVTDRQPAEDSAASLRIEAVVPHERSP